MADAKEKSMENLTWVEFKQRSKEIKAIIIPWGAMEAHGTHLPLSTDTIFVNHIAQLIAEKINALVLPALPIGYCFHASSFPGTISLTEKTLQQMAYEIAESLKSHGIKNLIFISGHGGNVEPLEKIVDKLRKKLKINALLIYPFYLDETVIEKFNQIKTTKSIHDIYHAEELETSLLLAINPDLVKINEAKVEYPEVHGKDLNYKKKLGDLTQYCVFGDPTQASTEKGKQFIEIMLEKSVELIEDNMK